MSTILVLTVVVTELTYTRAGPLRQRRREGTAQAYWVSQTGINIYKLLRQPTRSGEELTMGSIAGSFGINLGDTLAVGSVINTGLMRMLFAAGGDASDIKEDIEEFKASEGLGRGRRRSVSAVSSTTRTFSTSTSHRRGHRRGQQAQHQPLGNATGTVQESAIGHSVWSDGGRGKRPVVS